MERRRCLSFAKTAKTAERGREWKRGDVDEEVVPGAHWWPRGAVDSGCRSLERYRIGEISRRGGLVGIFSWHGLDGVEWR